MPLVMAILSQHGYWTRGPDSYAARRQRAGALAALALAVVLIGVALAGPACSSCETESLVPAPLHGVAGNGSTFVAVGAGGVVVTSADAQTWTARQSGITTDLYAVTWGDGRFVAVGDRQVCTSADGIDWTCTTLPGAQLRAITRGTDCFVAAGNQSGDGEVIYVSADATFWASTTFDSGWLFGIATSGAGFAAVGNGTAIYVAPGCSGFEAVSTAPGSSGCGVAHGNGGFVAVGFTGETRTSTDGVTWTLVATSIYGDAVPGPCTATYGGGTFVAVRADGLIVVSADGKTWTRFDYGPKILLSGVAVVGDRLLAVGPEGHVLTATCAGGSCSEPVLKTLEVPEPKWVFVSPDGGSGGEQCGTATCVGDEVCVSGRSCSVSAFDGSCSCAGSNEGSCFDFMSQGVDVTECGDCGPEYTACCPRYSCVQGTCSETQCP